MYLDAQFSDHNPFFDTVLFGAFAWVSDALTGSWNAGLYCFDALQAVATAFGFSLGISYLDRLGAPKPIGLLIFLFFAFVPIYPIYAMTMVKDSVFSWLYVLYFIEVAQIVETKGLVFEKRRWMVCFVTVSILLALTKKTGVYLVIAAALLLLVFYRAAWKRLLVSALIPSAVLFAVFPLVIFPMCNVAPGGKQEALSPLFQQTARYVSCHYDDIPDSERESIDVVLGYYDLPERYEAINADPVKFMWNYECSNGELVSYFKTYLIEGIKDPVCYFEAWFATASGYLAPTTDGAITVYRSTGNEKGAFEDKLFQPACLDEIRGSLFSAYDELSHTPGIDLAFHLVLYCFWVPVWAFLRILKDRREWLPIFIPTFLSVVFC